MPENEIICNGQRNVLSKTIVSISYEITIRIADKKGKGVTFMVNTAVLLGIMLIVIGVGEKYLIIITGVLFLLAGLLGYLK